MIQREPIYAALWSLASGATEFAVADRRLRHWSDVSPAEQPALFMSEKGGLATHKRPGAPTVWTLYADFFVYVHSSDPYAAPATILNPLIDALELALAPSPVTGLQQLGLPSVQHAWIAGKVETDEGVLGDQAVAVVPIEIVCVDIGGLPPVPAPAPLQGVAIGNSGYVIFVDQFGSLQIRAPDGTLTPLVIKS
jgi:hypothetical protein